MVRDLSTLDMKRIFTCASENNISSTYVIDMNAFPDHMDDANELIDNHGVTVYSYSDLHDTMFDRIKANRFK